MKRVLLAVGLALFVVAATAQTAQTPQTPQKPPAPLWAVEITTGPGWDAARPPGEQAHFREHSVHLKRLRDDGRIVLGARYGDKGLLVLQAATADEAHTLLREDPSIRAGTFAYALHEFRVFYGGTVQPRPRPPQ